MSGYGRTHFRNSCKHPRVMPDPITGDWCCAVCFELFGVVPDSALEAPPPRKAPLRDRVLWAWRWLTGYVPKTSVVEFVWTVDWAKSREGIVDRQRPRFDSNAAWFTKVWGIRPRPSADLAKLYPSMVPEGHRYMEAEDPGLDEGAEK